MKNISVSASTHNLEHTYIYTVFEFRFSNYLRFRRVLGCINRFIHNCICEKASSAFRKGYQTVDELNEATVSLLRIVGCSFLFWPDVLAKNGPLSRNSNLSPPFTLTRSSQGRRKIEIFELGFKASIPESWFLPTILCKHLYHSGSNNVQTMWRRIFWKLSSRSLIRKYIKEFKTCFKLRATAFLPKGRSSISAFQYLTSVWYDRCRLCRPLYGSQY